ncbi:MAG: hypothetical protein K6F00_07175, partial [Lachnospiraceae bacterium]|nr:hypothetical protein [Lachnospiraceae bacterium]
MKDGKQHNIIKILVMIFTPAICVLLVTSLFHHKPSKEDSTAAAPQTAEVKQNTENTSGSPADFLRGDGEHLSIAAVNYEIEYPVRTYVFAGTD